MPFTPIGKLLDDSVKKAGIHDQVEAALVLEKATDIFKRTFGEDIAANMKPLYVRRKVLTVSCTSSVVAQELKLREHQLIKDINAECGAGAVERLRFFA